MDEGSEGPKIKYRNRKYLSTFYYLSSLQCLSSSRAGLPLVLCRLSRHGRSPPLIVPFLISGAAASYPHRLFVVSPFHHADASHPLAPPPLLVPSPLPLIAPSCASCLLWLVVVWKATTATTIPFSSFPTFPATTTAASTSLHLDLHSSSSVDIVIFSMAGRLHGGRCR